MKRLLLLLRRLHGDRSGMAAAFLALTMVATVGTAAYVVDMGNVMVAHRQLQAATDAAALAGAADINCCAQAGQAVRTARTFSAQNGSNNATTRMTVAIAPGYPILRCVAVTGVSCTGPDNANAIVVRQTATIPMIFARIVGIRTMDIAAISTAAANAGKPKPLDVMIVLDTTASMNTADPSCSIRGATRLTCATAGARTLLATLSPSVDNVGLMVFPGVKNAAEAAKNYDCSTSNPAIAKYNASPLYKILGLGSDYRASDTANGLATGSNLSRAFGGGGTGCQQGMAAVGGVGTFFADALNAAQASLRADGRPDTQKVIILLSDGDAGATAGNISAASLANQCQQAIAAAGAIASAGTWIYSIAYGAPINAMASCPTDLIRISACTTMQQIASEPGKFYSDQVGGGSPCTSAAHSVSELVAVFTSISDSFKGARLLSDNSS